MPDATPIFTKRDPVTGVVLFDFDGHVHAQGLDFTEPVVPAIGTQPPATARVQWLDAADGTTVREYIDGKHISQTVPIAVDEHWLELFGQDKVVISSQRGGVTTAAIEIDNAGLATRVVIGNQARKLLDAAGNSDYLVARSGQAIVRYPGAGSGQSNIATISHGLGHTPTCVVAVIGDGGNISSAWVAGSIANVGTFNSSTFQAIAQRYDTPAAVNVGIFWVAI